MASYFSFAVSGFLQNGTTEGFKDKDHIYLRIKQNVQNCYSFQKLLRMSQWFIQDSYILSWHFYLIEQGSI